MPTRRARLRRRIYRRLPRWMKEHDFEVFAAFLGIAAGLPILLGEVQPASPETLLPRAVVFIWALVMVAGCSAVLVGVITASRLVYPERIFWMRVEALGLTALAYFCYIYSVCVLGTSITTGWSAGMIIFAFGGVCHVREVAIQVELEEYRKSLGLKEKA